MLFPRPILNGATAKWLPKTLTKIRSITDVFGRAATAICISLTRRTRKLWNLSLTILTKMNRTILPEDSARFPSAMSSVWRTVVICVRPSAGAGSKILRLTKQHPATARFSNRRSRIQSYSGARPGHFHINNTLVAAARPQSRASGERFDVSSINQNINFA